MLRGFNVSLGSFDVCGGTYCDKLTVSIVHSSWRKPRRTFPECDGAAAGWFGSDRRRVPALSAISASSDQTGPESLLPHHRSDHLHADITNVTAQRESDTRQPGRYTANTCTPSVSQCLTTARTSLYVDMRRPLASNRSMSMFYVLL